MKDVTKKREYDEPKITLISMCGCVLSNSPSEDPWASDFDWGGKLWIKL